MKNNKTNQLTIVSLFFAIVAVVAILNKILFTFWIVPITPTIVQVPVIIASITLGPKLGSMIGAWWGILSSIIATVTPGVMNYLFSPLQPNPATQAGDLRALIVAIVPRILVGIVPYFLYQLYQKTENTKKIGLLVCGGFGSAINTFFVLGAIHLFFNTGKDFQTFLISVVTGNSIAEFFLSALLVMLITPTVVKVANRQ